MSYDFVLFETDGDPGSARISKTSLTERIDFASPSTTPVLESLAKGLADTAPETVALEEGAIHLSGDRCLYVVTNYNSAEDATAWLTEVAFDYGLGLADMNADTIVLFGDEDASAVVQIDGWFSPAYSSYGLPHLLVEIMRLKDAKTPYLRVTKATDDSQFIQTLYETDEKRWLLETSFGEDVNNSYVKTINDVIVEIDKWFEEISAP